MSQDRLQSDRCAGKLKALSEPLRLRIVDALREGPANVSRLAQMLDAEIVIVSHHLGILRNAGLVEREKEGRFVIYRLAEGLVAERTSRKDNEMLDLGCCRLEVPKS